MINPLLDTIGKSERLVCTGDNDDDFPGVHDCSYADCQSHLGDFGDVIVEES